MTPTGRFGGGMLRGGEFLLALAIVVALWHAASVWVGKSMLLPSPTVVARAWLELAILMFGIGTGDLRGKPIWEIDAWSL